MARSGVSVPEEENMTIFNDATELVGHTPLVRINKLAEGSSAEVLAKLEFYNPANSVKDRAAVAIMTPLKRPVRCAPVAPLWRAPPGIPGSAWPG